MIDELQVPDSLPNYSLYFSRAVAQLHKDPGKPWTTKEKDILAKEIGVYAGQNRKVYCNHKTNELLEVPVVATIIQDLEHHRLPKYVCLIKWLSTGGLMTEAPKLISEIARIFLKD
jgi:hypothetical protein